jgi:ribosomal protein L11 methyltransferase
MDETVDLLMANIIIEPLLEMLPNVPARLKEKGRALFSGLLVKERERFCAALEATGLRVIDELSLGDWWGVTVEPYAAPSRR